MHMDTDDLSREAYEGIIFEAERLTPDLTLHYGLLSYDNDEETELKKRLSSALVDYQDGVKCACGMAKLVLLLPSN
jgi:hypothetical protein